ncbi:MBL fold metallo-hydrolase [Actinoplanes sp. CA-142083]|uniref:MBL fold metallo-hydrolase n=1 Tax=Actinoplanes sp. CA-142083 TaxID=3239903 RepID=UPI003D8E6BA0
MKVHSLLSPWGRFGLHTYFLDTPEPAIVDTGIATSPAEGMAPTLEKLGRRIEDVRWILLTHGHIDHIGGAHALWELTGRRAQVVIHEADAPMLRSRRAHVDEYLNGRGRYLRDPDGEAKQVATAAKVISGEMEPTLLVRGGETLDLGGGTKLQVHAIPGHTKGSVAYALDGHVFVGDAVQIHGAANGFPGYEEPAAYRASLQRLRDEIRPNRLYLGHPYRRTDGTPYGVELDAGQARAALQESLDIEARVAAAAERAAGDESAFAGQLGYRGDPTLEPSPFFTTLHGYHHEERP